MAIRGQEVMQTITFELENARKDAMKVTPIGICLSYYVQSNNFIFVEFNGERVKLYDNGKLSVTDAAMQMQFPNDQLFPRKGEALLFTVNGKTQHLVGMTHHYSWSKLFGLTTHGAVNDLTPNVGDPNSQTPEYKAFLVNIEKTTV